MTEYLLIAIFFWLIIITIVLIKTKAHYQNLISSTRRKKLDEILDQLIKNDTKLIEEVKSINEQIKKIIDESKLYIQKIGFVRYDPFESRGEQSFVIALLDEENSGIVINFIYTRDGLRVYSKRVKKNHGDKYELSDEEKKAIEKSNFKS